MSHFKLPAVKLTFCFSIWGLILNSLNKLCGQSLTFCKGPQLRLIKLMFFCKLVWPLKYAKFRMIIAFRLKLKVKNMTFIGPGAILQSAILPCIYKSQYCTQCKIIINYTPFRRFQRLRSPCHKGRALRTQMYRWGR